MRLVFLFYEQFLSDRIGKGFELNPYDPCVMNKIIGGKQMKVFWHVGDLKVSHMDTKGFTNFMEWLEGVYGVLRITRVKVHE